jgi:hypothetical protein
MMQDRGDLLFVASMEWVDRWIAKLTEQWGNYPELDTGQLENKFDGSAQGLFEAQKIIEAHLWGGTVSSNISLIFTELINNLPGQINYRVTTRPFGRPDINMKIEISEKYRNNPKAQMAILVHEYSHAFHFLRDDFERPIDNLEYENLTDLSIILLGMGDCHFEGRYVYFNQHIYFELGYLSYDLMRYAQSQYIRILNQSGQSRKKKPTRLGKKVIREEIYVPPRRLGQERNGTVPRLGNRRNHIVKKLGCRRVANEINEKK